MTLEFVRKYCKSLPHVTEDVKWGNNLCFLIAEKMFCLAELEGDFHASVKVGDEEFEELTTRQGIIQAPYMGRHKWILIDAHADFSQSEWEKYIAQSYELVKKKLPKKVKEKLGI